MASIALPQRPGEPPRKTDAVIAYMKAGLYAEALSIAKDFKLGITPEQKKALVRGHEAKHHPRFWESMGRDPETLFTAGVETLKTLHGHRFHEVP